MSRRLGAVFALSLIAFAHSAWAADNPEASPLVAACDALATHPADSANPTEIAGLGFDAFDAAAALAPCQQALAAFSDHARTAFHLARAEHKLGALPEAEEHYRRAAEQGYVRAMAGLMVLYADNPDLDGAGKAIAFGDACAAQGDLLCQIQLGQWFELGHNDVPRDPAKALTYRRMAAAQGDAESQYLLALALERGEGVETDITAALDWYRQAAAQGDAAAAYRLGRIHMYGIGVAPDYDTAFKWMSLVAEDDDKVYRKFGQYDLGMLYFEGGGVAQDRARALELFEASAAQGLSDAQSQAGWMYDEGVGVAEDDAKAVGYYLPAAEAGDFFAQNNLAVHYERGEGVPQDDALALHWYEKAAEQGDAEDQYIVAGYYLDGIGTEKDFYKAAEWFRRAADQGLAKAAAELEQMIADGLVVPGPAD